MAGGLVRSWLRAVIWLNARLKSAAVRLTRLTGKSSVPIHPKHLVGGDGDGWWYLAYVKPGMHILDLGCGNGMHTIRAARHGALATGIDRDGAQLGVAQTLLSKLGAKTACFVLGDLECPLPFGNGRFEIALLLDVIEHVEQRRELLREIHRIMRPAGMLLLSAPNRDTRWKRRLRGAGLPYTTDPDHKVEYQWEELRDELGAGGFEPVGEPVPIVLDTPWAGAIDFVGGLSLGLYRRLRGWKATAARRSPAETTGWQTVCRRLDDWVA